MNFRSANPIEDAGVHGEYLRTLKEENRVCHVDKKEYPESEMVYDNFGGFWLHSKNIDVHISEYKDLTDEEKEQIRMDLLTQLKNK